MYEVSQRGNGGAHEARTGSAKKVAPQPVWDRGFRVGDLVRTVGGGGSYDRGEVVEVVEEEKSYRVDYGLGFPSLIRGENLEPFDEKNPMSEPPRSFVPPLLPFM